MAERNQSLYVFLSRCNSPEVILFCRLGPGSNMPSTHVETSVLLWLYLKTASAMSLFCLFSAPSRLFCCLAHVCMGCGRTNFSTEVFYTAAFPCPPLPYGYSTLCLLPWHFWGWPKHCGEILETKQLTPQFQRLEVKVPQWCLILKICNALCPPLLQLLVLCLQSCCSRAQGQMT